ncbi:phospholipase D-like domain-containing protein [Robertkochia marina]|nr:phospholipase D-like domain-containing protein [Robertkochia marina]
MFTNRVECDIYVGKGAGNKLLNDLRHAEKSIKIVSPFISPKMLEVLKELHQKGVQISLISQRPESKETSRLHQLFYPILTPSSNAFFPGYASKYVGWFIVLISMVLLFVLYQIEKPSLIVPVLLVLLSTFSLFRWKSIPSQRFIFPTKLWSPNSRNRLHTKFYIIDNKIAYLGSLNFTRSGIYNNHESRVRTIDSKVIQSLNQEFEHLMQS